MQQFLSKHCIESLLDGKKATFIARKENIERNKNHMIFSTKDQVQKIIDKSQQKAESRRKIIYQQMNNQNEKLAARIERRKSMSNKSTKTDNEDIDDL